MDKVKIAEAISALNTNIFDYNGKHCSICKYSIMDMYSHSWKCCITYTVDVLKLALYNEENFKQGFPPSDGGIIEF